MKENWESDILANKITSIFRMVGALSYKDKPKLEERASTNNPLWKSYGLQFGVKVGNGFHYLSLNGGDMYLDVHHTNIDKFVYFNSDKTKIELTEEEVNTPEILEAIPFWRKKRFHDTEFVYNRDFIKAVYDNLETLNGKLVYIAGNIELSYSSDKDVVYKRFVPNIVRLATDQETEQSCSGDLQLFFDENAVDPNIVSKGTFNQKYIEEMGNKILVKGYLAQYNNDKNTRESIPHLYYPLEFNIKTDKIDFDNPVHTKVLQFMVNQCIVKGKKVVSSGWKVKFQRGNSEVELTEEQKKSMLTREELDYLALFPQAEEEFLKKKLQMTSERVDEIWLTMPHPNFPVKEIQEDVSVDMLELYKEFGGYSKKDGTANKTETKVEEKVDFSMFD